MSTARKPKDRASQNVCRPRSRLRRGGTKSVVQALLRRQALGRKGNLPTTRGLPRGLGGLVYSMSNVIPAGLRHDRVLLGFTADGEHVAVCCGPPANPSRLELRRVRLQWPGLSRPGEDPWVFPLRLGLLCNTAPGGGAENGEVAQGDNGADGEDAEEEQEEEEEGLGGLGMGMGDREPASVAVTESADGFLVVAVVSLRYASEMQEEEDRVYRVFVAPGPSYVAAVHAPGDLPFLGTSFSYIVPGGGGAPFPSIVAHDVGSVDGRAGPAQGQEADRLYVIVLNAVDTIHALEVRLHASGGSPRTDYSNTPIPLPPDTKFTISPRGVDGEEKPGQPVVDNPGLSDRCGAPRESGEGVPDADRGALDPLSVWWAFGRDLPSCPLISTHPLACRRPAAGRTAPLTPHVEQGAGAARAAPAGRAGGAGIGDEAREVAPRSGGRQAREVYAERGAGDGAGSSAGTGESGGQTTTGRAGRGKEGSGRRRAVASIDKSRQRVFDLEVFISQLLLRREAFPEGAKRGGANADAAAAARAEGGDENGVGRRCSGRADESGDGGRTNPRVGSGGNCAGAPCRSTLATDYHCVTAGLVDGGRRVLLCLVIEVVCSGAGRGSRSGGRTPEPNSGGGPELLGYVLALDLGSGEVAVLGTKSGRGNGVLCDSLCDSLARSFRRCAARRLDPSGRRLSNAAVMRGRSLGALVNPVFPVAIVRGGDT